MSGSSTSHNHANLIGCRVAGAPTYVPAHIPAGAQKPIRQMATLSVYQNINGKPSRFRLTAWGKLADVVAKSCAPGKELHLDCEIHSYAGKIPVPNNNPNAPLTFVTDASGQPMTIEKTGFVIRRIHFGQDSDKQIQFEIQNGMRPPMWNVSGHADNAAWKNICQQRNSIVYQPGSNAFGYAQVRVPNGQLVDPATLGGNTGGGYNTGTAQAQGNGGYTQGFQGVQHQQVNVHGQNMGYQMPQGQAPAGNGYNQPANTGYQTQPQGGGGTGFAM